MPDPFEALRTAPTPIDPDPAFAARLRARVARLLQPATGEPMIISDRVRQGDITYMSLYVQDLSRAATFYERALGWRLGPVDVPWARQVEGQSLPHGLASLDSVVAHYSALGLKLPDAFAPGAYVTFAVPDIEAAVERVRAAGGQATPPGDFPYGRLAECMDDQGMVFGLHQARELAARPPATGARQGDVAYIVFEVPGSARARAFYGAVLGLEFSPGRAADGWNIAEIVPMSGLAGGRSHPRIVPMYRVDDIRDAVARIRAAGGRATDPVVQPYGIGAECIDDQGTEFYVGQL
jgi:predicted enzyme related to lactoylglutathione lyase